LLYTRRDGVCTRIPPPADGAFEPASAIGPAPARSPDDSIGSIDDSDVDPPGPISSASAHAARLRSGADEPLSSTINQSFDAFDTSISKPAVDAERPATILLNALAGPGTSSPSSRRAPRDTAVVKVAPFTSPSSWSVVELLTRIDVTWSRIGRPSARVRFVAPTRHSRA